MNLSRISHLPVAAFLAVVIMVGMPALARLQPRSAVDPWLQMRPPLHPVAGTLLCDGRPVEGAIVTFVSDINDENREYLAVSTTDKNGRFWLRTFSTYGDGAVGGGHRIRVEKLVPTGRMLTGPGFGYPCDLAQGVGQGGLLEPAEGPMDFGACCDPMMGWSAFPGAAEMVNILPARFADEETSGLAAEVSSERPNEFEIELRAEAGPGADGGT